MNCRKKIIFLEDSSQSSWGGGQNITYKMLAAIDFGLANVTVIDTVRSVLLERASKAGALTQNLDLSTKRTSSLKFNFLMFSRTIRALFKLSPDIVYVATRKHIFSAVAYKLFRFSVKVFVHNHTISTRSAVDTMHDALAIIFADKLIHASEFSQQRYFEVRKFLGPYVKGKVHTVAPLPPFDFDLGDISLLQPLPIDPVVIGYVGRLSVEKGLPVFLQTLKELPLNFPWRAIILGHGPLEAQLGLFLEQNQALKGRIEYLGFVKTSLEIYSKMTILIVPSFGVEETIGLTALEGLACGIPTMVAPYGNLKNLVKTHGALPLPSEDSIEIAKYINTQVERIKERQGRRLSSGSNYHVNNNFNNYKVSIDHIFFH